MSDDTARFLITDIDDYTPHVSRLMSMMNYTRHTTMESVNGLTMEQLDFLSDPQSNSIGALLSHVAAVEYAYQVRTFEKRKLTEAELSIWRPALELGALAQKQIRENELFFYINQLDSMRRKTFELFRTIDDHWLHEEAEQWFGKPVSHYFMWFHVFEDELNHRGQIRMIRKKLNGRDEHAGS